MTEKYIIVNPFHEAVRQAYEALMPIWKCVNGAPMKRCEDYYVSDLHDDTCKECRRLGWRPKKLKLPRAPLPKQTGGPFRNKKKEKKPKHRKQELDLE